ncbi:ThuA domain-containing protein [Terriglobus sp. TAA 43]|uniref:ThuA domain-containing protein n=1 Tax=Terriglobus sp. TAA 43 TaxID=278961 RepID=UPI0006905D59|nr:ThuA domain-containing protein [Terriglobus sp. TAA 43]
MLRALLFLFIATLPGMAQTPIAPVHRIQVLIITGQDKHPWRETSPYLKGLLEASGKFEVRTTEEFKGANAETLRPYDVAVLNYSDEKLNVPDWSDSTKEALLEFVRSGKGLVVYHHSAASFQNWPEYRELVGCIWKTSSSYHSPVHDYQVNVIDSNHPVTLGLTSSFSAKTDELYAGLDCIPTSELHVLATGWDDHSLYVKKREGPTPGSPSQDEPLLWTRAYGRGRVFATMLGNDMRAVRTPGFISTFVRGTEWAATGSVTIPPEPEVAK